MTVRVDPSTGLPIIQPTVIVNGGGGGGGTSLPDQAGNSGKYLKTDGTTASWATPAGGSGITRTVVVTSGNVSAGSTANTDYVYIIAGNHTVTLPTAVGNTNRYTVKNNHTSSVALAFNGSETADGGGVTLAPKSSVDLISDGINWNII